MDDAMAKAASEVGCLNGADGTDWFRVQGMVRRMILDGEGSLHHPVFDYLWLPEFAECEIGATTLRLLHLVGLSSGHLFLEYFPFTFEVSALQRHPWSIIARSGWGASLFCLLNSLSQNVCAPADVRRGGLGIWVPPGYLPEIPCEGDAETPNSTSQGNVDNHRSRGFARAVEAAARAAASPGGWDVALDKAQRWLMRAVDDGGSEPWLLALLRTQRPLFALLYEVAERYERSSGHAPRAWEASKAAWRRSSWTGALGQCVRSAIQTDFNHSNGYLATIGGAALACAPPSVVTPPAPAQSLKLCGIARVRVSPVLEVIVLGAAIRGVARESVSTAVELDIGLFFDRLDQNHGCDTWLGAHLLRPECEFSAVGLIIKTPARVLSGLTWLRPIKASLFTCTLPKEFIGFGRIEVNLIILDQGWRIPFNLCTSAEDHEPDLVKTGRSRWRHMHNVTICTEPFHSVREENAHIFRDVLEYHVRQGAFMDVYDLDGSAVDIVADLVAAGQARYFPFFPQSVSDHVGDIAIEDKDEPAGGCSAGLQEMHCILGNRGRSKWVVPRLDPDEYFARAAVAGDVRCRGAFHEFKPEGRFGGAVSRHRLAAVFISSVEFGGRPVRSPSAPVYMRFVRRSPRATPRWIPIVNPNNALSSHIHSVRPRPGTKAIDFGGLALHHYLDAFGHLVRGFIGSSRIDFKRRDERLARTCWRSRP